MAKSIEEEIIYGPRTLGSFPATESRRTAEAKPPPKRRESYLRWLRRKMKMAIQGRGYRPPEEELPPAARGKGYGV